MTMKKHMLFFFLFFFACFTTNAQSEDLKIRVDTSYFPYVDNIQMIQIEYTYNYGSKRNSKNIISDYNYSYSPIPDTLGLIDKPTTKYIFRDKSGEIISSYNDFDKQAINKDDFREPDTVVVLDDSTVASLGELFIFYYLDSVPAKKKGKIGSIRLQRYSLYGKPTIEYYGKQGLINRSGRVILEPEYDEIFLSGKSPIIVQNEKIGFLNQKGEPITPIKFRHLFYSNYGWIKNYDYHVVSVDSLLGIIDHDGNTLLGFDFKYIDVNTLWDFNNCWYSEDNKSNKGQNKTDYDNDRFYYIITKDGKQGFINARTLTYPISPDKYDDIGTSQFIGCCEFIIRKANKYGYIQKFEEVIPLQYDTIIKSRGYIVKKGGLYGMYSTDFIKEFDVVFDSIIDKDYGYLAKQNGKYGFYNESFELKITIDYDTIIEKKACCFYGKIYISKKEGGYGLYDQHFNLKIPVKYDTIIHTVERQYVNGYVVNKDGHYGLYNLDFQLKVPVDFDTIIMKSGGYIVKKDNFFGFYDRAMNLKIPTIYQDIAVPIYNNSNLYNYKAYYFIQKDSLYAIVNENFEKVTPFEFDEITKIRSVFKAKKGEYYTILDSNLKPLCKPILKKNFEPLVSYQGNYYQKITTKDGKYGILGLEDFFLKPIYDEINYDGKRYKDYIYFDARKGKRWKKIKVKPRK